MTSDFATDPTTLLGYVENAVIEDELTAAARDRAEDLGAAPIPASVGAALSVFARMIDARTVVEIGTGAGISGLWLYDGMSPEGVLTTIDIEPEHQRAAREAFRSAGIAGSRTRLINGRGLDVLPRLTDAAYDLVFIDAPILDVPQYVAEGIRVLRPGGMIIVHGALRSARVADPNARDAETIALRAATRTIAEDEELTPLLLPIGAGLLCGHRSRVPVDPPA